MNSIKNKYRSIMKAHNRTLFLLEITFKVLFIVLFLPAFHHILDYIMGLWGQSYITEENLLSFLNYPPAIFALLVSFLFLCIYLLLKTTAMICFSLEDNGRKQADVPGILTNGFLKMKSLLARRNLLLPLIAPLFFLFTNIPLLAGITVYYKFPTDFWDGASDRMFVKGLIFTVLLFLGFITFRMIFTIHFCIHGHEDLHMAMKHSKSLLKGRMLRTAARLFFCNALLILVVYIGYYIVLLISALAVFLFTEKYMAVTVFLSIYPRINFYVIMAASMAAYVMNLNIITTMYQAYFVEDGNDEILPDKPKTVLKGYNSKQKHIKAAILLLVLSFGGLNLYHTIRTDAFQLKEALPGIKITSHRGNSKLAPENTLPALLLAIEAKSDYIEIDLQQTKDGILILMHDRNLWRTTGLNKEVADLTCRELKKLDAGSWYGSAFSHTLIPTLEEAILLCKGKVRLNLEVKTYGEINKLTETLIEIIDKYNFESQCVISSWDYDFLCEIKKQNPKLRTGLIISAVYGNFYRKEYVDFYSIRSSFLTKSMVESVHREGREVHAWTVNKASEIDRMKSLGVDCIISDDPILAREILYRDDTNENFVELLNKMLNHRSFYQIVQKPR